MNYRECTECGTNELFNTGDEILNRILIAEGVSLCPFCVYDKAINVGGNCIPTQQNFKKFVCAYRDMKRDARIQGDHLYFAAFSGNVSQLVKCLKNGENPGYTYDLPLRWSTANEHLETSLILLIHGCKDLSWSKKKECLHDKHLPCTHALSSYSKEVLCILTFNYIVKNEKYEEEVRKYVFCAICVYANFYNLSCKNISKVMNQDFLIREELVENKYENVKDAIVPDEVDLPEEELFPDFFDTTISEKDDQQNSINKIDIFRMLNEKKPDGFIVEDVPADGDCFYHAFIKALNLNCTPDNLRQIVANEILRNNDVYEEIVQDWIGNGIVGQYKMTKALAAARTLTNEWATNTVINIISKRFDVLTKIYKYEIDTAKEVGKDSIKEMDGNFYTWRIQFFPYEWMYANGKRPAMRDTVNIILRSDCHFDLLRNVGWNENKNSNNEGCNGVDEVISSYGLVKKLVTQKHWLVVCSENLRDIRYHLWKYAFTNTPNNYCVHPYLKTGSEWTIIKNVTRKEAQNRVINRNDLLNSIHPQN